MNIHIYLSLQKFTCDFFLAAHFPLSLPISLCIGPHMPLGLALYWPPYASHLPLILGVNLGAKWCTYGGIIASPPLVTPNLVDFTNLFATYSLVWE